MTFIRVRCVAVPGARPLSDEAQALYTALGAEIRRVRGNKTAAHLADEIDRDQTTVSNYELGKGRIPLDAVWAIEDACNLARGELLVRAQLIAPEHIPVETTVEAAIEADVELDRLDREALKAVYKVARLRTAGELDRTQVTAELSEQFRADERERLEAVMAERVAADEQKKAGRRRRGRSA